MHTYMNIFTEYVKPCNRDIRFSTVSQCILALHARKLFICLNNIVTYIVMVIGQDKQGQWNRYGYSNFNFSLAEISSTEFC